MATCTQFPASDPNALNGFEKNLGDIAGGFGAGMYTWDKNFQSLLNCKSVSYDHKVLDRCYKIMDNIQQLTALCFYSSTDPYIVNDKADIAVVCPIFNDLYINVIQFDQEIGDLFKTLYLSYPSPTSTIDDVNFPLDSKMPTNVDCNSTTWQILSDLNLGIANYIKLKSVAIGNRFKAMFSLNTCTALPLNPPSIPEITLNSTKSTPVAFIICMIIACLIFIRIFVYIRKNWKKKEDGYIPVETISQQNSESTKWSFWLYNNPLFWLIIYIITIIALIWLSVQYSLKKSITEKKNKQAENDANNYQQYKIWQGSDLQNMIPNGDSADFILSSSPIDSYSGNDPTHGNQSYIKKDNENLITVENDKLFIRVGTSIPENSFQSRPAVRMAYKEWIQSGVVVLDLDHIPTGPGVWPSFWLNGQPDEGDSWSSHGEIDIIEGLSSLNPDIINADVSQSNTTTLHTQKYKTDSDGIDCFNQNGESCSAAYDNNIKTCGWNKTQICPYKGCPVVFPADSKSFGKDFNANGGGTYACRLTKGGEVTVWFWPRGDSSIPKDLYDASPKVDAWTTSVPTNTVKFSCPNHFQNMALLFNTAICGDWAGQQKYFDPSLNQCPCNAYCSAGANNKAYEEAYWSINKLAIISMK
jgi:uncharacterized membrane protein